MGGKAEARKSKKEAERKSKKVRSGAKGGESKRGENEKAAAAKKIIPPPRAQFPPLGGNCARGGGIKGKTKEWDERRMARRERVLSFGRISSKNAKIFWEKLSQSQKSML